MRYTLIDLFAGIGGIRLAFETTRSVTTVYSSEIEKYAREYYARNFNHIPEGDLTAIPIDSIPYADIVAGGIPCQPFSVQGQKRGLADNRGALVYRFADIIRAKQPKAFFIENVRGLVTHRKGETFRVLHSLFHDDLGYTVYYHVYNSAEWGTPQTRRRVYIVGFRESVPFIFPSSFEAAKGEYGTVTAKDILETNVDRTHYVGARLWQTYRRHIASGKRNGFSAAMLNLDGNAETLLRGKSKKNLVRDVPLPSPEPTALDRYRRNSDGIRFLTPREMARLQQFPDSFVIPESGEIAGRLLGNAVTVGVVYHIAREIVKTLDRAALFTASGL